MASHPVHVTGFAPSTTETHLHDFFSFCGPIKSIDFHGQSDPSYAVIHFEKPSAAKTALMLNGGTLDQAHLKVTSEIAHQDEEREDSAPIDQTDKPRAGIVAEYLAKGYKLQDHILQRAIDMDNKQGISKRFLTYLTSLDSKLGSRALGPDQTISGKIQSHIGAATQQVRSIDEQKGFSKTAHDVPYYTRALASPFGQKVLNFYTTTSKQVQDIHEEARRIAATHKAPTASQPHAAAAPQPTTSQPAAVPASAASEKAPDSKDA